MRLTEAFALCARLNAMGARLGARQVAFNAALMGGPGRTPPVPAPTDRPANDTHDASPPSA